MPFVTKGVVIEDETYTAYSLYELHVCTYEWTSTPSQHWQTCEGCDYVGEKSDHGYSNSNDATCNTCGYTRQVGKSDNTTTVIIIVAELLLARFEYFMVSNSRTVTIFVEYSDTSKLTAIVETVKENSSYIRDIEITKSNSESNTSCAIFSIQMPRRKSHDKMINIISNLDGVVSVEEL